MHVDLDAPDHTTPSQRSRILSVELHRVPANGPSHLVGDATGLSIVGEGEWAAVKEETGLDEVLRALRRQPQRGVLLAPGFQASVM